MDGGGVGARTGCQAQWEALRCWRSKSAELGDRGWRWRWLGPRGAHLDPGGEVGDLGVGELVLGGHLEVDVLVVDGFDEAACSGVAGDDGGAGFAAFEEAWRESR